MKRKLFILVITVVLLLGVVFGFVANAANKEEKIEIGYYKYYTQYDIEHGDTLYGIAEKYMKKYPCIKEVYSLKEYTEEIAEVNNLGTTKIIAGQHLVVPYLEEELH